MPLSHIQLGTVAVSRLILGGNPFSGFSHQSPDKDREMVRYFTAAHIKDTLRQAEEAGINTFIGRADKHIVRTLAEYWDEGGTIQWIAQTCPEFGSALAGAKAAVHGGASAVYLHGGQMDFLYAQNRLEEACEALAWIKASGHPAGIAAHNPAVHTWANEMLTDNLDFHMCSYYNPTPREQHAEHHAGDTEFFDPLDRERMTAVIQNLRRPAIHYKIFAAGRTAPAEAFAYVAHHLRPIDAVCIGIYPKDNPAMISDDVALFQHAITR